MLKINYLKSRSRLRKLRPSYNYRKLSFLLLRPIIKVFRFLRGRVISDKLFYARALLIILFGLFLRFYNYGGRWGLASDQAQFAVVARYALDTFQLPLLGPFSSGGPFQTGGEWYWIVMIGTFLWPYSIKSAWIFLTLITAIAIPLAIYAGSKLVSKNFGLLFGFFVAISSMQISQSSNLTNQTPIIIISMVSIIFTAMYLRSKRKIFMFFLAFSISLGSSIHIQSVALFPLLMLTFLGGRVYNFSLFLLIAIGFITPWSPVLLADSQNQFYNTKNMLLYFTSPQAQVPYEVLGRRWLTFLGIFIPTQWSLIIGGFPIIGYFLIAGSVVIFCKLLIKRIIKVELVVIYLSLLFMIIILRYTRTPLFESFFIFIHPFVIFISAFFIYSLFYVNRIIGVFVFFVITVCSIFMSYEIIINAKNITYAEVELLRSELKRAYPNVKFSVYDYKRSYTAKSIPFVLDLYFDGIIDERKGKKIGLAIPTDKTDIQFVYPSIWGIVSGHQLYNLDSSTSGELEAAGWSNINPSQIYNSTQYWFRFD